MKYREYSAADFANDSFFIRWVRNPDEESTWFWNSFIIENPQSLPAIEEAKQIIRAFTFQKHELREDELSRIRNNFLLALHAEKQQNKDQGLPRQVISFQKRSLLLKIAATVLILCLAAMGIHFFKDRRDENISMLEANAFEVLEQRVNPPGQKSVLFLADGTKVRLNAASKISYLKAFDQRDTREVYLEGEAFFEVAHRDHKPFIVHTSSIRIKVLGTSFNVKSYAEEETVETTLVQGKVRIEQSDSSGNHIGDIELKPNQRAVFNKQSRVIRVREVSAASGEALRRDEMVLDGETLDNVIVQLERWFSVKIHAEGRGALTCRLTATLKDESLEEVLKLIEVTHAVSYRIEGKDVYLQGKLCNE
jgi:transmembrane sensor